MKNPMLLLATLILSMPILAQEKTDDDYYRKITTGSEGKIDTRIHIRRDLLKSALEESLEDEGVQIEIRPLEEVQRPNITFKDSGLEKNVGRFAKAEIPLNLSLKIGAANDSYNFRCDLTIINKHFVYRIRSLNFVSESLEVSNCTAHNQNTVFMPHTILTLYNHKMEEAMANITQFECRDKIQFSNRECNEWREVISVRY